MRNPREALPLDSLRSLGTGATEDRWRDCVPARRMARPARLRSWRSYGEAPTLTRHLAEAAGREWISTWTAAKADGAPCRTRTCDLLVRSQTLYPTELRARTKRSDGRPDSASRFA